jgi:enoyl-CoA hydratase/carnithine racemase
MTVHAATVTPPGLRREGDVLVLDLGSGENRVNPDLLATIGAALDEVEATEAPRALVTTATGKFWSNGLDLEWLGAHHEQVQEVVDAYHRLLARVLGLGAPTVAAVQGHAFAAGAMLASAHDAVVMREDRGFWCVPEADLGMPFTAGMTALLAARLPTRTAHEAMTTARRYGGPEAVAAGIADEAVAEADVLPRAIARAAALAGKQPQTLAAIKRRLHADAIATLQAPQVLGA